MAQAVKNLAGLGLFGLASIYLGSHAIFTGTKINKDFISIVDPGHQALIFSRFGGLRNLILKEGFHFVIPYFEWPVIYDVKTKPRNFQALTANRGDFFSFNSM